MHQLVELRLNDAEIVGDPLRTGGRRLAAARHAGRWVAATQVLLVPGESEDR
jgi:hypothetical protein